MRSAVIGLRLCGIADEPFWPRPNGSSTSRTSVRARWRISSANASSDEAMTASVESSCACRSRWMICVECGAGSRPSRSHASRSSSGPVAAYVPTAPDSLPTRSSSRARLEPYAVRGRARTPSRRASARRSSARRGRRASGPMIERPAVLLRPGDDRVEGARQGPRAAARPPPGSGARARCRARPTTSGRSGASAVPPRRGPSPTASTNAARSWPVRRSISATCSGDGGAACARAPAAASAGTTPSSAHASSAASSTSSQSSSLRSSDQTLAMAGRE